MRPLLQHASRSLTVNAPVALSLRLVGHFVSQTPSICLRCEHRAVSTALRKTNRVQRSPEPLTRWLRRPFSSSTKQLEERRPPHPASVVPPASGSQPTSRSEEAAPGRFTTPGDDGRLRERLDALIVKEVDGKKAPEDIEPVKAAPSGHGAQERLNESPGTSQKAYVADNITRVPDENLPSHRARQRWDLSKRFSEFMDDLLPKLAVVTQKVNTYTGTDYSGVEALRREIIEQEQLVKARRAAIDTARQTLDAATSQQASAQKEVVALLERKHSWSNGDLERYMSLIRSEHVNDQAVTEAKEAVFAAESALEEARTRLEKRERAQYHEEQIWSDTIRRNSTWVTFGLMGVNIFLLLLSLLIFEPWRRRRIVREIKSALEAQKMAAAVTPVSAAMLPAAATALQDRAAIEAEIDNTMELMPTPSNAAKPALSEAAIIESSKTDTNHSTRQTPNLVEQSVSGSIVNPVPDRAVPLVSIGAGMSPQDSTNITEEALHGHELDSKVNTWRESISWVAHDIVSDRIFSMRRVDFTTAILQSAAAGAVIAAALIAMIRRT